MPDLRYVCETFISKIPLTVPNLPHWMSLSVQHGIESAQDRCYEFAADHSDAIRQWVPALKLQTIFTTHTDGGLLCSAHSVILHATLS